MSFEMVGVPAANPVTLAIAKQHLRVTHNAEDDLINLQIASALEHVEMFLDRPLLSASYAGRFSTNEGLIVFGGFGPCTVTSLTYRDSQNAFITIHESMYCVGYAAGKMVVDVSKVTASDVTVNIKVGTDPVPPSLIQAMLLLIGDFFNSREANVIGTIVTENPAVKNLLQPHRLYAV